MITVMELLIAVVLDLAAGDPADRWHPVSWTGKLIARLEAALYPVDNGMAGGLALAASALVISMACVAVLLAGAGRVGRKARLATGALVIYYTVSFRSLLKTALDVQRLLIHGRLDEARSRLCALVGRDLEGLSAEELTRATVESIAENASDGAVAPLFYAAIGGPVLAAAYRTANTLDSMVGYHNEKYSRFGMASARIDDLLNLVPSRLTALALLGGGAVLGKDAGWGLDISRRDARKHKSPNAGWPEAAMAGLLRVRLGGANYYGGREVLLTELGEPLEPITSAKIGEAVKLAWAAYALALLALLAMRAIVCRWWG